MARTMIYLDNNATTRPLPEVVEAMAEHFRESYANPGSRHAAGRRARRALETARESLAAILGAKPTEVVFTSGGTEASNLALFGLAGAMRSAINSCSQSVAADHGTILLTRGEHPATLETCRELRRDGWGMTYLEVDSGGRLQAEQYDALPWDDIHLATVILAHNETGVIQGIEPLAIRCRERGVPLHVDAVQAVGKIPVNFQQLGATTLSLGAHKFHGPRGIGALLVRDGVRLAPRLFGGHQEAERRPGTEPVALAVGMARALESWHAEAEQRTQHVVSLRDRLEQGLLSCCFPAVINGSREHRLPNTLNIAFPGLDGDAILVALDLEGVCCSLGSTCSSGSTEPAPSLVAMGCLPEVYQASVRFSVGIENTEAEIDEAVQRITAVITRLRAQSESMV